MRTTLEAAADRMAGLAGHRYAWPVAALALLLWHDAAATDAVAFLLLFVLANAQDRAVKSLHVKVDHLVRDSGADDAVTAADARSAAEIDAMKRAVEEA